MKIKGLDGKIYHLDLRNHRPLNSDTRPRSQYHKRARELLIKLFPSEQRLEEIYIPGSDLYIDFFLPAKKMVIEVQGEQHYKFSEFFHKDKSGYLRSLQRDMKKTEWCELNLLNLVELPYNETINEWTNRIVNCRRQT